MISIEVRNQDVARLEKTLARFSGDKIAACINRATYRGALHARKVAIKQIRSIYTINIKSRELRNAAPIKRSGLVSTIDIKGPFLPVEHYQAARRAKGIFVTIKEGSGALVPMSFAKEGKGGVFRKRIGPKRYPIEGLYGPAIPQLYGNKAVVELMEQDGMNVYAERLMHELERLVGDA